MVFGALSVTRVECQLIHGVLSVLNPVALLNHGYTGIASGGVDLHKGGLLRVS